MSREIDYSAELRKFGWYRAETTFTDKNVSRYHPASEDPVVRKLRHSVGIYTGSNMETANYVDATPWVGSAEDLFELEATKWVSFERGFERKTEEELRAAAWPTSPREMTAQLRKIIPRLQSGSHNFWDPGFSDWYAYLCINHPRDMEKVCKPAYLHAELWKNEKTSEELWMLVALKAGWRVPDEATEEAVWRRVTGQSRIVILDDSDEDDYELFEDDNNP